MADGGHLQPEDERDLLRPRPHRAWTPLGRALAAAGNHWTLMIVLQLEGRQMRLSNLQGQLPGASPGVLERYIAHMVALGLVSRSRFREMPPRVELALTPAGEDLLPLAHAMARWGMRHMWSSPQGGERVDVDAVLRLLPVLLDGEDTLPQGSIEAIVTRDDGTPSRHIFTAEDGHLRIVESVASPTAGVEGSDEGWVNALCPACDYGQLSFSGDEAFARSLLDALPDRARTASLI